MATECKVQAYTAPVPPVKEGFRRVWIHPNGKKPYWHYQPVKKWTFETLFGVIGEDFAGEVPRHAWAWITPRQYWNTSLENWVLFPHSRDLDRATVLHNHLIQAGIPVIQQIQKQMDDIAAYSEETEVFWAAVEDDA